jgi:uncharacterized membrane protein HdeD (DUF308 family)
MDFSPTLPGGPLGTVTGIVLILLGILALVFPVLVFSLFVVFFAIFGLVVSIELVRAGISGPGTTPGIRTLQLGAGLLGILLSFAILVAPYLVSVAAKEIFGIFSILAGIANILSVFTADSGAEKGISAIFGLVLALTGLSLLAAPALLADYLLVLITGFLAIILGVFSIWFARAGPVPGEGTVDRSIYK